MFHASAKPNRLLHFLKLLAASKNKENESHADHVLFLIVLLPATTNNCELNLQLMHTSKRSHHHFTIARAKPSPTHSYTGTNESQ